MGSAGPGRRRGQRRGGRPGRLGDAPRPRRPGRAVRRVSGPLLTRPPRPSPPAAALAGPGCPRTGAPAGGPPAPGGARQLDPESAPAALLRHPRLQGRAEPAELGRVSGGERARLLLLPARAPGGPPAPGLGAARASRPTRQPSPGPPREGGPAPTDACAAFSALTSPRGPCAGGGHGPGTRGLQRRRRPGSPQAAAMLPVEKLQRTRGGSGAGPRASFYPQCPAPARADPPPPPLHSCGPPARAGSRGRW